MFKLFLENPEKVRWIYLSGTQGRRLNYEDRCPWIVNISCLTSGGDSEAETLLMRLRDSKTRQSTALSFSLSSSSLASSYGLLICNISYRIKITNEYLIQLASNSSDKCSLLTWVCLLFVRVEVFRIGDGEHVVPGVRRRPSLCSRDGKHRLQPFKWEKVQSFVFWVLEEKQQKSLTGCIINFTIKCKSSTIFQETGTYESCLFLDLSSNPASSLNPAPATTPGQRQPLTPVCGAVLLSNLFRCNHCLRHPATNFLQLCILW